MSKKEWESPLNEADVEEWTKRAMQALDSSGDSEKIRRLIRDHMSKSSWKDEVKRLSLAYMTPELIEEMTPESIAEKIHGDVMAGIPKQLRQQVESHIRDALSKIQVQP